MAKKEIIPRQTAATASMPERKKICIFCKDKTMPTYVDASALRRFVSDRGRIIAKQRSGVCSKHQRTLTKEIKHARHLALLPFTVKI